MSDPSSEKSYPDQPSLAVGETMNSGARTGAWIGVVGGGLTFLASLALVVVIETVQSNGSGRSGALSLTLGLTILSSALTGGVGLWTLQRFPLILIKESGLQIRDQVVPFASITEVVKKERTVLCIRYIDQGVINEAMYGVSWMLGSDLAPVARWLASRAESARAQASNKHASP